jgi:hypothetical protein
MTAPHWLYEDGIGEARAALVADGEILEALIEREGGGVRAGAILPARLVRVLLPGRRGLLLLDGGEEALIEPVPPGVSEGGTLLVEILREALPEPGLSDLRHKLARARAAAPAAAPRAAPTLAERLAATPFAVTTCQPHGEDALEAHGWSELLAEATGGEVVREAASLRLFPTPAMMLIDVDGGLPSDRLAIEGAALAARAIRRMGIGGSIGVDLPTSADKTVRLAAAARIDAALPQPFERTAVNGFGFVQIVRRRARASLVETLRADPVRSAALAILRRAGRDGSGVLRLHLAPAVAALIGEHDWLARLERRRGGAVTLVPDPDLPLEGCHVA